MTFVSGVFVGCLCGYILRYGFDKIFARAMGDAVAGSFKTAEELIAFLDGCDTRDSAWRPPKDAPPELDIRWPRGDA